jgi:hypothetical protein
MRPDLDAEALSMTPIRTAAAVGILPLSDGGPTRMGGRSQFVVASMARVWRAPC